MRLKPVSPTADCSHHASFQPSLFTASSFRFRTSEIDGPLSLVFASKTLLKSRSFNKISRGNNIRRSCSLNLDDEPSFHVEASAKISSSPREEEGRRRKKQHCAISSNSISNTNATPFFGSRQGGRDQDSFLESRFDFLEPMMLGIGPEFPEWPDQETAAWAMVEQKANSLDIPLSLRMIKKKLQLEEGFAGGSKEADTEAGGYCSVKAAFASMVFIIVELQTCALHMREALCDENLDVITSKVQKEMHMSFVWLFQQVFSRTPALMLHVMVLLANFSVHSISHNTAIGGEASLLVEPYEHRQVQQYKDISSSLSMVDAELGGAVEDKTEGGLGNPTNYPSDEFGSVAEMLLWDSMVDEAKNMKEGNDEVVIDPDITKHFVSPVSVEIEPDTYQDFLRTDLLYQMNLSFDPDNTLLLLNYARFLQVVARDYQRSEACFKRAVQVTPPDGESFSEYANFLWTVRKDYWAAEESFLQALALEPNNVHFASSYANFLWTTGGEDTCFPLNNSSNV